MAEDYEEGERCAARGRIGRWMCRQKTNWAKEVPPEDGLGEGSAARPRN